MCGCVDVGVGWCGCMWVIGSFGLIVICGCVNVRASGCGRGWEGCECVNVWASGCGWGGRV